MLSQPYLRHLRTVGQFTVWLVNGAHVRSEINEQFTNFGQHYRFPFIPKYEFWIDHLTHPQEIHYFIDHLIAEWRAMDAGASYVDAIGRADRIERAERHHSRIYRELHGHERSHPKEVLRHIHVEPLRKYSTRELAVWIVRSDVIRDLFYVDFTEGGHGFVYPFVPMNEVWIDEDLTPHERPYVVLHELHERNLMAHHRYDYPRAHRSASAVEAFCRHHPTAIQRKIAAEARVAARPRSIVTPNYKWWDVVKA